MVRAGGTPVVLRDSVLVATRTSKDEPHHSALVLALDRASGRVLWQHAVSPGATDALGALGSGAATADRVAVAMIDGRVMAFDVN